MRGDMEVSYSHSPTNLMHYGRRLLLIWILLLLHMSMYQEAHAGIYQWKTGSWSRCTNKGCGPGGTQSRDVWCSHIKPPNSEKVSANSCAGKLRPITFRVCFNVCDFHRFQYMWKIDNWSTCLPRGGKMRCEENIGVQNRNVTCVAKCGNIAPSDDLCEHFEPRPITERLCQQACPSDCIMTDYGSWGDCTDCWRRSQTRFRQVLSAPAFGGANCSNMFESRRCESRHHCTDNRHTNYQYKAGRWTECLPYVGKGSKKLWGFTSVLGHKRRTVDCIDVRGKLVDERYCAHLRKLPTKELCVLPKNCLVSHWSNWTSFGQSFAGGPPRALLMRERNVLQLPRGNGLECPVLDDTRPPKFNELQDNCHKFKWIRGGWGPCRLEIESDMCGAGAQSRTVLCVRAIDSVPVADHNCAFQAPSHTRTCHVPCPQDCTVSQWSSWSNCLPDRCRLDRKKGKSGYRIRSREVLGEGIAGGKSCSHLKEVQPCEYPPCYYWSSDSTASCQLKYPDMQCGEGILNRSSSCVTIQGTTVSPQLCFNPKPAVHEICYMPCAHDCVTSEWSTWSDCSRSCGEGRVAGHRTRWKDVLAQPGPDGSPCPPMRMLLEKERCNEFPCFSYYWHTTEWSKCHFNTGRCGEGKKYRETQCFRNNGKKISSKRCQIEMSPQLTKNCSLTCPKDCVVSAFTDWSECPVTCIDDSMEFLPEQERRRFILEEPSADGLPCPELRESRPCMNLPRCATYQWHVSEWSHCLFPNPYDTCGNGYRAREVKCLDNMDDYLPEEICISQLGSMPDSTTTCQVVCSRRPPVCRLSGWSEWGVCSSRCGGSRNRTRSMEGITSRIAECYDRTKHPLIEKKPCTCPSYQSHPIGEWSSCMLDPPLTYDPHLHKRSIGLLKPSFHLCGAGRRYQASLCMDGKGNNASASVCEESDFQEEMCFVPCPRDCQLSQWSEWGSCVMEGRCGTGHQARSRYLIETSLDGGRDCPHLYEGEQYEKRPCYEDCDQYNWATGEWSICTTLVSMTEGDECGPGLQSRIIRCMKTTDILDPVEVDEEKCDTMSKPKEVNYCHVPCPGQCVITEWTQWSACTNGCASNSKRERTRKIVRHPAKGSGNQCPHLLESEACTLDVNCFVYAWNWSLWSDCLLASDVHCGNGRRTRYRMCVRGDVPVSSGSCFQAEKDTGLPSTSENGMTGEEACHVPCPIDCVVSQWTHWTGCSETCGLGFQTRSRSVLIHNHHRGRHCPKDLVQHRPCSYAECFRWKLSEWTNCNIDVGVCGYGLEKRNLECMRHDGVRVDDSLCPQELRTRFKLSRDCIHPCPGDCVVSDWGSWGECHRPCEAGLILEGTQTRSRSILSPSEQGGLPCPPNFWETRPCRGGNCPLYSWQTSYWFGDRRNVWCQRADGLQVIGGCEKETQPSPHKACNPKCTIEHSYCQDVNHCACERLFVAVLNRKQQLVKCEQIVHHNHTLDEDAENQALYYPEDGPKNFWMYAVIAAGCAFIVFVAVALYTVCRHTRKESNGSSKRGSAGKSSTIRRHSVPGSSHDTPLMERYNDPNIRQTVIDS